MGEAASPRFPYPMNRPISHLKAICFAIAGFTFWVLCDSTMKLAGRSQLPTHEIVAFLGIFIAFFLWLYSLMRSEVRELWPKRPARLIVRVRSLPRAAYMICSV